MISGGFQCGDDDRLDMADFPVKLPVAAACAGPDDRITLNLTPDNCRQLARFIDDANARASFLGAAEVLAAASDLGEWPTLEQHLPTWQMVTVAAVIMALCWAGWS